MAARKANDPRPAAPIVVDAPLVELRVYEITEAELERLESGPPGQIHLGFALALLPAALSVAITIQTAAMPSNRTYYVYCISFGLLFIHGLIELTRWWFESGSNKTTIQDIRGRMPARPGLGDQILGPPAVIDGGIDPPPSS